MNPYIYCYSSSILAFCWNVQLFWNILRHCELHIKFLYTESMLATEARVLKEIWVVIAQRQRVCHIFGVCIQFLYLFVKSEVNRMHAFNSLTLPCTVIVSISCKWNFHVRWAFSFDAYLLILKLTVHTFNILTLLGRLILSISCKSLILWIHLVTWAIVA